MTDAARALGYRPNLLAQGLRRQQSSLIGFAVADIANPIFADIVHGAEQTLRDAGYSLLLTNSAGDPTLDAVNIGLLEDRQVDGLLLSLTAESHPATIDVLRASPLPMVLLDRDTPPGVRAMSAYFDHGHGMVLAVEHLLRLGHRDVALILGGPELPARARRKAVEETLWAGGGRCLVVEGGFGVEGGYEGARTVLQRTPRPTALIAAGNTLMAGALRALHEARIRIGPEMSFVGCDNVLVAELHQPPISVVVRNPRSLGETAAGMLLAALSSSDGGASTESAVLPTEFLPRASIAKAHVPTPRRRSRS